MPPDPIQQAQTQRQWDTLRQQRDNANDTIVVLQGVIASLEAQLAQARAPKEVALVEEMKADPKFAETVR